MKMNMKTVALIYSLNAPAEVTIIEMVGNNKYLAEYKNHVCAAMFNPFTGTFFVDDVNGKDARDFQNKEGDLQFELNYLLYADKRELNAYRTIGTVQHFKRLKEQETKKRKLYHNLRKVSSAVITGAGLAFCVWAFISGLISIIA